MELISIIVPCYNVSQWIEQTVHSIQQQTYKNLEIVLVNDGSQDNTLEIITKLAAEDYRIVIVNQDNEGVTSARLNGVRKTSGNWIGFVDGDDLLEPDMYEHLLKNAHIYNASISHCGYRMVFPNRVDYYYNTGKVLVQDKTIGIADLIRGDIVEPGLWNKLYSRDLFTDLIENNIMDLTIKNLEDLLMNYYLFRKSEKSVYEDFCPYHYVIRNNSASTSELNENKVYDPIKVFNYIKESVAYSDELTSLINARLLGKNISNSLLKLNKESNLFHYRQDARKYIRKNIFVILRERHRVKSKISSLGIAICPSIYSFVYSIYLSVSGLDKKYRV